MTRWLILAAYLFTFSLSAGEPGRGDADREFSSKHYAEALKDYQTLRESPDEETRLRARYRAVEAEALLFRYGEAAADAFALPVPNSPLWRPRFLLLRAQVARAYLEQYGDAAPKDVQRGSDDPARLTGDEWRQRINEAFFDLHRQREALVQRALADESYFIETEGRDLGAVPTFWDLVVQEWTEYLLTEKSRAGGASRPAADSFLDDNYPIAIRPDTPPATLAASLWEEAAAMTGDGRALARELARVSRFLLPYEHAGSASAAQDSGKARAAGERALQKLFGSLHEGRARARVAWQLAQLWNADQNYAQVLAACEAVSGADPATPETQSCAMLSAQTRAPELSLLLDNSTPQSQGASGGSLSVRVRNVPEVFVRLYPVSLEELRKNGASEQDWGLLRRLGDRFLNQLLSTKATYQLSAKLPEPAPYAPATRGIELPKLASGFYAVVVSNQGNFEGKSAVVEGGLLNVSDLYLFGDFGKQRRGPADAFHLYALDGKTGEPAAGVVIESVIRRDWNHVERNTGHTGDDGSLTVPTEPSGSDTSARPSHYAANIDPLATRGDDHAFWPSPLYHYASAEPEYEIHLDTDRGIYRPGQTLEGKVTVLARKIPRRVYRRGSTVKVEARDASGERFFRTTLKVGAMGSAVFSFTIPTGRLLGSYSISAELPRRSDIVGSQKFSVEEYLRPTFEITLDSATRPWKYRKPATVTGHARYYSGAPVGAAPVSYRVFRESMLPEFCWWWSWRRASPRAEIAHGEIRTDGEGTFALAFTPQPDDAEEKDPLPARFTVEAEARDAAGRTVVNQRTYLAGASALLYQVTPSTRFFFKANTGRIGLSAVTLDGEKVSGTVRYRVLRVGAPSNPDSWQGLETPSLDELYREAADGDEVASGKVRLTPQKKTVVLLPPLPPGIYRLRLQGDDGFGDEVKQAVILASLGDVPDTGIAPPAIALAEKSSYAPGERARVLVGSPALVGGGLWQLWRGDTLLWTKRLGPGLQLLMVPISEEDQGGLTVRWLGVYQHQVRGGTIAIEVPCRTTALKVTLKGPDKIGPGEKATWEVDARDSANRPIDGEALLRVYDRSLDALAVAPPLWADSLYPRRPPPAAMAKSLGAGMATGLHYPTSDYQGKPLKTLLPPDLRLQGSRVRRGGHLFAMAMEDTEAFGRNAAPDVLMAAKTAAPRASPPERATVMGGEAAPGGTVLPVRRDFSESAVFAPQVRLVKGHGSVTARMPDSLTSWSVTAQALTTDVKGGVARREAVTRKDLMVRLELPRFVREGDTLELKALIDNGTAHKISGQIRLSAGNERAASQLGLTEAAKTFSVDGLAQGMVSWRMRAPEGDETFHLRATASANGVSDAEERELPLLPARQRIFASRLIALDGDAQGELSLKLPEDAAPERAILQIDPQLALAVVAALPGLLESPYDGAEAVIDRYVPLAVTSAVFAKYPQLAAAVKKIPKRSASLAAWERDDPRRQTRLIESPWSGIAAPEPQAYLDLLDRKLVDAAVKKAITKLNAWQLPSGAFPWFPGGPPDRYFTLYVLNGIAEAARFGIAPPQPLTDRALGYLSGTLPELLKPESGSLALALYAAFTVTQLATPSARNLREAARKWVDYAVSQPDAMTPFGKAYAAQVYHALGDTKRADDFLDRALDGAREDAATGVYWAPEKQSWLWYEDTVEKHAFFLRTLAEWRPQDPRLPGLAKWLLYNRKATQWKSARSSAAAIYGLIDFLKSRGALEKGEHFSWQWGGERGKLAVTPTEWLKEPARWTREGKGIPSLTSVRLEKRGPGLAFASLGALYVTHHAAASEDGPLVVERHLFRRARDGESFVLEPLSDGARIKVGDEVEVQLILRAKSAVEYAHLVSPRGAGLEPETTESAWTWDQLARYHEPRDSLDQFYLPWIPAGEYVLRYRLRATLPGTYAFAAAQLQSLFSPDLAANSAAASLEVD